MTDTIPVVAPPELPTLFVVVDMTNGEFHGAFCNESTAHEREYSVSQAFPDADLDIMEYVPHSLARLHSPSNSYRQTELTGNGGKELSAPLGKSAQVLGT
jgi:hypothetical protein